MENNKQNNRFLFALKSAGIHLIISMVLAGLAALLVFKVWYPYPYVELTGGLALYKLVVGVDVVCGPLLTLILASPKKSKKERAVDFSLIGAIQLAALIYGLYSVSLARPVAVAFEVDRFNVVTAAEVYTDKQGKARPVSWWGVERLGIREPKDAKEQSLSLDLSLQGIEPSMRSGWWVDDSPQEREKVKKQMKPLSRLAQLRHISEAEIINMAGVDGHEPLFYLPLTSSHTKEWVVLLNKQADFVGFAPIDGFK